MFILVRVAVGIGDELVVGTDLIHELGIDRQLLAVLKLPIVLSLIRIPLDVGTEPSATNGRSARDNGSHEYNDCSQFGEPSLVQAVPLVLGISWQGWRHERILRARFLPMPPTAVTQPACRRGAAFNRADRHTVRTAEMLGEAGAVTDLDGPATGAAGHGAHVLIRTCVRRGRQEVWHTPDP